MPDFQPLNNLSDDQEPVIDLESSGIIDLEHPRLCGGNSSEALSIDIVEPLANPRCAAADREILRSRFTDV